MGLNMLLKLLNVVSDNGSDATAAVKHMFQLINATVGYEQMRPCNHVMESLAADRKTSLDLVSASITHLIKHCENGETTFKDTDQDLTMAGMKAKLQQYEKLLVQEPAIVAAYLNPQLLRPTNFTAMGQITALIRSQILRRYSNIVAVPTPQPDRVDTLFAAMFEQVQNVGDEIGDEVEKYLSLGIVTSSSFIDVMEWWTARKDVFPAHYQMAADYLGTPATSTPSKRVNSMAGREFTTVRQSLSSSVFIQTMCLRSWIDARVIKVPSNRAKVATDIEKALGDGATASVAAIFDQIAVEQDHWEDEVLDDGVVELMNSQFERFVLEAEIM
ncbi:unnamed protein product [Sphagnum jensenii]|uniref:HAT C-terminal dimerisation domain-containing protein n=1 Tax=Sphagnum jensenii TaxID=128206 RepID=A0ABP0WP91_9BRYO